MTLCRRVLSVILAAGFVGLTACPQQAHVWIEPDSNTDHLLFRIGRSENHPGGVAIGVFRIDPCNALDGSRVVWLLTDNTATDKTDLIEYGRVPRGFSQTQGPQKLEVGCYRASVSGAPGYVEFDVEADGTVRPRRDGR
jgi:hypothetical protein